MTHEVDSVQSQTIQNEISELERHLRDTKTRLNAEFHEDSAVIGPEQFIGSSGSPSQFSHHFMLLLADSALPLGSFAFSSGLESYLGHTRPSSSFLDFLALSLSSYASTMLPFVLAAHRNPHDLMYLDDSLDATIMCTVGRRASVAQGRALLSIWDRSFRSSLPLGVPIAILETLKSFTTLLRSTGFDEIPGASAHLAPLFGAIAGILGLTVHQTAYVFMLNHVKALLSAAVRASVFGPYQAQSLLAGVEVQDGIIQAINQEWNTKIEDAGQSIPVMDLWVGRHEMLYSRIFNS